MLKAFKIFSVVMVYGGALPVAVALWAWSLALPENSNASFILGDLALLALFSPYILWGIVTAARSLARLLLPAPRESHAVRQSPLESGPYLPSAAARTLPRQHR